MPEKKPVFVESGRRGARRRWGEPRILRLDSLTPEQRRVVLALINAAAPSSEVPAPVGEMTGSGLEVRRAGDHTPPAA